ncbi:hypothetical protein KIW84_041892, partial [Lathyrus oleraceus]
SLTPNTSKHFLFSHSQPHLHENILASILNIVPPPSFTTHHLQLSPLTVQFSIHAPLSVSAASTPQLIFQRFVARRSFPPTHSPLIPFRYKNQNIAVKIINKGETPEEISRREARFGREVAMLSKVQHKNLVRFIGACKEPVMVIVTELLLGGTLRKYLLS